MTPTLPFRRRLQDGVARAFGLTPETRVALVEGALDRGTRDSATYWLQLVLSMAIATFGLVLGSTAVVIGAMLVSPLMGPIVELGLGLAVGSPLLVLRSVVRTATSIGVVISAAALLTLALPFHELTSEIAARTSPTALDLLIAVCCALAAAYTQLRAGSDTAATAAGTAIGIALVPPLCVAGYGLGTREPSVSTGALLLFTANLSAIIVVTTASFVVLGFDAVDVRAREHDVLGRSERVTLAVRAARVLERLFRGRSGAWVRLAMPLLFLASVYIPLQQALAEVSWEIRVRAAIQRRLDALPLRSVGTSLHVKRHAVHVGLVVVGSPEEATSLQRKLEMDIATVAGVRPKIEVLAVAEASQLPAPATPRVEPAAPPTPEVARVITAFDEALRSGFPTDVAGRIVDARLVASPGRPARAIVAHVGAPIGAAAERLLAERLGAALATNLRFEDVAVGWKQSFDALVPFVATSWNAWSAARESPPLRVCLEVPAGTVDPAIDALRTTIAARPGSRLDERDAFTVWLSDAPCPVATVTVDAGADGAADGAPDARGHD